MSTANEHIKSLLESAERSTFARIELIKLYVQEKKGIKIEIDTYSINTKLFAIAYDKAKKHFMNKVGSTTIWDKFGNFIKTIF